jgi:hypothetical protein
MAACAAMTDTGVLLPGDFKPKTQPELISHGKGWNSFSLVSGSLTIV